MAEAKQICNAVDVDGDGSAIDYRDYTIGTVDTNFHSIVDYCEKAYKKFYFDNGNVETILSTEFIDILCKEKSLKQPLL